MPAIARAYVEILPETRKFSDLVAAAIRSVKDPVLSPQLDAAKLRAEFEALVKSIDMPPLVPTVDASTAHAALDELGQPIDTPVDPLADTSAARAALDELAKTVDTPVVAMADVSTAKAAIESVSKAVDVPVVGLPDFSRVRAEIAEISKPVEVPVSANRGEGSGDGGMGSGGQIGAAAGGLGLGAVVKDALGGVAATDTALGRIGINAQFSDAGLRVEDLKAKLEDLQRVAGELGADPKYGKFDTSDFVRAAEVLTKANLSIDETKRLLPDVGNLAVASGGDIEDVARQVANVKELLKVPKGQENVIVDTLAAAEIAGRNGTIADYANSLAYVGAQYTSMVDPAKRGTESAQELLGTFAFFDNAGVKVERLGTTYQSFLTDITGGGGKAAKDEIAALTENFKKQHGELEGGGNIFFKANGEMRSMVEIQKNLKGAVEGLTPLQRTQALNTLFQSDSMTAANAILDDNAGKLAENIDLVKQQGFAQKYAENQTKGLTGAIEAVSGAYGSFKKALGDLLKGPAEGALRGVASYLGEVKTVLDDINKGGFSGLLKGLEGMSGPAKIATAAIAAFGVAALAALTPVAVEAVIAAAPFIALGAAVVAVGAAAVYAYNHFEGFRNAVDSIVQFVTSIDFAAIGQKVLGIVPDNFVEKAQQILGSVQAAFTSGFEAVKAIVETAVKIIQDLWDRFGQTLIDRAKGYLDGVMQVVNGAFTIIKGLFDVVAGVLTGDWSKLWEGIKEIVRGAWSVINGLVDAAVATMQAIIGAALGTLSAVWSTGWHALHTLLVDVWGLIQTAIGAGIATAQTAISGATKAFGSAFTAFKDVAVGAINAIKAPLDAVAGWVSGAIDKVKSLIDALGRIKVPSIHLPSVGSVAGALNPFNAEGGVFEQATLGWFGEAGAEAILPLTKPYRLQELLADSRVSSPILQALAANGQQQRAAAPSMPGSVVQNITVPTAEHALIYARAHAAELFQRARSSGALA